MTAQGRKLQVIDFFEQCCLNATRGRERVVVHPRSEAFGGSFGRAITPTLSYDATRLTRFFTSGRPPESASERGFPGKIASFRCRFLKH